MGKEKHSLTTAQVDEIVAKTEGYSGSDVVGLISEAALGPIRDVQDIASISVDDVRPIAFSDFAKALSQVRASVSDKDLKLYLNFDQEYGSLNK